jgi:hypothetical protein
VKVRSRPLGVAVIVLFELLNMLLFLLAAWDVIPGFGDGAIRDAAQSSDLARAAVTVMALTGIVAAVGLWFLSRRAWVLTMVLVGITLVLGLYSWAIGEPAYLRILLNAVIALYLNQPAVQAAVGRIPPATAAA